LKSQLIAERALHAVNESAQSIHLKLYAPENIPWELSPELFPWRCAYELDGAPAHALDGETTSFFARGIDSLDALLAALSNIRGRLDRLFEKLGLQFTWDAVADVRGGHGIPHPIITDLGLKFEREMITLMWQERRSFAEREPEFMKRFRDDDDSEDEA
jgi:hypothetical protein